MISPATCGAFKSRARRPNIFELIMMIARVLKISKVSISVLPVYLPAYPLNTFLSMLSFQYYPFSSLKKIAAHPVTDASRMS
jgi:hypothetical protein